MNPQVIIYDKFIDTFNTFKSQFWKFSLSSILDAVFLWVTFIISSFFFTAFETQVEAMANVLSENEAIMTGVNVPVAALSEFKHYLWKVIVVFLVYLAVMAVINLIFKSFQWFISSSFVNKKIKLTRFLGRFFSVYIVYALIIILSAVVSLFVSYATFFSMEGFLDGVMIIILSLVMYFSLMTFSLLHKFKPSTAFKKSFGSLGIKNAPVVLLGYLIPVILLIVFYFIIFFLKFTNIFVVILASLLLGYIFTYSRTFLIKYFKEIEKN